MKEKEFIQLLAEKSNLDVKMCETIVHGYNETVREVLKKHGELTINSMGKYIYQVLPEREVRNPATGEKMMAKPKVVAKWQPNKKFKDEMGGVPKK